MPPRQQQQQRRGVLGIAAWIHSITIAPLVNFWLWTVLGSIEESTTSLIREALALVQRSINGFSAWTLSVFNRDYKRQLRGRWEETWAAYSWWREQAPPSKQGTLNAVLARRYGESQDESAVLQPMASAPAGLPHSRLSSSGMRHRHPSATGQQHPAAAAAAAAAGGFPAKEAQEAAAAAQQRAAAASAAASAAVQQAASSVSSAMEQAVEEAAAAAAALARNMRGVFEAQPAGWGVHEAIRGRTGLLEDISLFSQLLVMRTFDAIRWLVSCLTLTPAAATAAARPSAAAAAAGPAAAAAAGRQRWSGLRQAAAAGTASPRASSSGAGSTRFGPGGGGGRRIAPPSEAAFSSAAGSAAEAADEAGDFVTSGSVLRRILRWRGGNAAAAAAAAGGGAGGGGIVRSPTAAAAAAFRRRSATSIDLTRSSRMWGSDSEPDSDGSNDDDHDNNDDASSSVVQEKHHGAISKQQQQRPKQHRHRQKQQQRASDDVHRRSSAASSGSSGSRGGSSARQLQRSHSGPAVSELRDVSSAGQVIKMAGYPLEVHEVLTADGYLLRMERLPQHGATDVAFMMHGVLDTSLTWVAGGITGSQAFAAWDRGFDVWLGTSRSNPPHAAADPRLAGSAYWCYTHNEVGMFDMGAQIDHIHATKMRELAALGISSSSMPRSSIHPYNLRVVCHSLGGLVMLIHCIQRVREGRPHHVRRLILLSPAGFHMVIPRMFQPLVYVWRPAMWYFKRVWRQQAFPVHLPTFMARLLAFKLTIDTSKLPAVGDLLQSIARLLLGGDRSAWDRALLMPHYAAAGMPLLSSWQVHHFIQLYTSRRCQLYDHGSAAANVAAYQQPQPPVLSECFHALRGVPVHLVAGQHDGVIPPVNIRCHYEAMKAAGVDVSYREFDYGHMDFTFSAKEELGYYVSSLLSRT
ncbi:hypothetical protein OEZ86_004617 [Tetradesmus obliquus]|nr:hypothetical protein OEZ86_004617 [Tetradesmus obliquus]